MYLLSVENLHCYNHNQLGIKSEETRIVVCLNLQQKKPYKSIALLAA